MSKPLSRSPTEHETPVARDLELTRLCAEAMGMEIVRADERGVICDPPKIPETSELARLLNAAPRNIYSVISYDPLRDDKQAMALVKRFKLNIGQLEAGAKVFTGFQKMPFVEADSTDLNRAIVECVAKIPPTRATTAVPEPSQENAPGQINSTRDIPLPADGERQNTARDAE